MKQSQTIGSLTCPSGNRVDAKLNGAGLDVQFFWDAPPPLTPEDHAYYIQVICPQAVMRAYSLSQKGSGEGEHRQKGFSK